MRMSVYSFGRKGRSQCFIRMTNVLHKMDKYGRKQESNSLGALPSKSEIKFPGTGLILRQHSNLSFCSLQAALTEIANVGITQNGGNVQAMKDTCCNIVAKHARIRVCIMSNFTLCRNDKYHQNSFVALCSHLNRKHRIL